MYLKYKQLTIAINVKFTFTQKKKKIIKIFQKLNCLIKLFMKNEIQKE